MENCDLLRRTDIYERRSLSGADTIQFILTAFLFLGSLLLKWKFDSCGKWSGRTWVDAVFYISLIWFVYLFISMTGRYKRKETRHLFNLLDIFFFLALLGLWIWLVVHWFTGTYFQRCNDAFDIFGFAYLVLGALGLLLLGNYILGGILRLMRPKEAAFSNPNVGRDYNVDRIVSGGANDGYDSYKGSYTGGYEDYGGYNSSAF